MGINLGLTVRNVKEEKYTFPVLTMLARKEGKGTASKMKFNQAAIDNLDLHENSKIIFGTDEDPETKEKTYFLIDGCKLDDETYGKLKIRLAKTDMSISDKSTYSKLATQFNLDTTKDNEFKLITKELEFDGLNLIMGTMELMTDEELEEVVDDSDWGDKEVSDESISITSTEDTTNDVEVELEAEEIVVEFPYGVEGHAETAQF